ncbi:MAG: Nudix family hydrolase [Gammaproteobacteria bacterium]|nr:Nudix family hydrolase [Gammaproteobacteria bacterium]
MPAARRHIAVGVVYNAARDRVLIAKRPPSSAHGGLWEFPGGKLRSGEKVEQALRRELFEELNLVVDYASPLLRIDHDYPGTSVRLDVWTVEGWHGEIGAREGQELEWVSLGGLGEREFPEANRAIIEALKRPPLYLITPDLEDYDENFFGLTRQLLQAGLKLLQFRSRLDASGRMRIAPRLAALCSQHGARLVVNSTPAEALTLGAHGVHLNSVRLLQLSERPLHRPYLVTASCHNRTELQHAQRLGLDFSVLGPVRPSSSHPGTGAFGWRTFGRLVRGASIPVYALGGLRPPDLGVARRHGACGIAMISGIWGAENPVAALAQCADARISAG